MPYMVASSFLGIGKETTRGTAVAPVVYLPVDPVDVAFMTTWLPDTGLRGSPVDNYGNSAGVQHEEVTVKGNVFADTIQHPFLAALGGPDVVTGSGAPYAHAIGLLNAPSTGSQPPSYTLVYYDGTDHARQVTGAQLDELNIMFAADAALTYSVKFIGNPQTNVSAPTSAWSTEIFIPAWDTVLLVDTVQSHVVMDGEIDLKRGTAPIFTAAGVTSPYRNFAGKIAASGKFSFVYESGDSTLATGSSAATKHVIVATFTEPVSTHHFAVTMSQVQYQNPKIDQGKEFVAVTTDFVAESNVTDGPTSYAPCSVVVTNAVAAAA